MKEEKLKWSIAVLLKRLRESAIKCFAGVGDSSKLVITWTESTMTFKAKGAIQCYGCSIIYGPFMF